jgi:N-carbamoylputrescine amidase
MRVCICEFPDEDSLKSEAWERLARHAASTRPEVVVLPEMPFCEWVFSGDAADRLLWAKVVAQHENMLGRLRELGCDVVSSRPIERGGTRLNEAFVWSRGAGYSGMHAKWYLPDAPTARETLWFHQGDRNFAPMPCGSLLVGCQLCSEMMFPEHAREIGAAGAHLIAQPRATGASRKWRVASEMSAITSGCYVLSCNRRSYEKPGFAGGSWLLSPEADFVAETSADEPFVTAEIDLDVAERAKATYPRDLQRRYLDKWPNSTSTGTRPS